LELNIMAVNTDADRNMKCHVEPSTTLDGLAGSRYTARQMATVVSYLRVSTSAQGVSGLGLDAQRAAIAAHCERTGDTLLREFVEVESGRKANRPQLAAALALCREQAALLVIARLDRLSRSVAFLSALQDEGVKFLALDIPGANEVTLNIMAAIAQGEAKAIRERTQAALDRARAKGKKLGGHRVGALPPGSHQAARAALAAQVAHRYAVAGPLAVAWRNQGHSLGVIAARFNKLRSELKLLHPTAHWTSKQVARVIEYAGRADREAAS
jgi:DNA invertase Pin-like site-specific DNA recombinase